MATDAEIERVARAIAVESDAFKVRRYSFQGDWMTGDTEWVEKHWREFAYVAAVAIEALRAR